MLRLGAALSLLVLGELGCGGPTSLHRCAGGASGCHDAGSSRDGSGPGTRDTGTSPGDTPAAPDAPLSPDTNVASPDTGGVLLGNGSSCATANQCESGFCVDTKCCDTACAGLCSSCNLGAAAGTCKMVPADQDPDNECPDDGVPSCGRDGFCDGKGVCRLQAQGTMCKAASCAAGTATAVSLCDGNGNCQGGTMKACSPYVCAAAACGNSCAGSGDCDSGFSCTNMTCVASGGNGPVAYWKLDEGANTSCADSSGNGNNATLTGGAWQSGGFPGVTFNDPFHLHFDGVSGYVSAGTPASLANIRALSVSAWINPATAGEISLGRIVNKRSAGGWTLFVATAQPAGAQTMGWLTFRQTHTVEGVWHTVDGSITFGTWMHVALTYDASSTNNSPKIYLNGTAVTVNTETAPSGTIADDSAEPLTIGNLFGGGRTFDGDIDDVRIYNRILSAGEIADLAAGKP